MSHVIFQREEVLQRAKPARRKAIPLGYGLALAAIASLALWGGIAWLVMWALG